MKRYRVSEYTDFRLGDGLPYCRWIVRERMVKNEID